MGWLITAAVVLALVIIIFLVLLSRQPYRFRDVQRVHGTARILLIISALEELNRRQDQDLLLDYWTQVESPLEAVLDDNTDETRSRLVELLNQAHAYAHNRELARSLMQMRNTLLDHATGVSGADGNVV